MSTVQLFCLPGAGDAARGFLPLGAALGSRYETVGLELPGRGQRNAEPVCTDFDAAVRDLAGRLRAASRPGPVVMLGHSMGGTVAVDMLMRLLIEAPAALVLVATPPPDRALSWSSELSSADPEFLRLIAVHGGVPAELLCDEVLTDPPTVEYLAAPLRMDLTMYSAYAKLKTEVRLSLPVLCITGGEDRLIRSGDAENWGRHNVGPTTSRLIPSGGHYLLRTHPQEAAELIDGFVTQVMSR